MLFLDYQDRRPIYEQIVEKFRLLILSGAMEPDSRMPSVRHKDSTGAGNETPGTVNNKKYSLKLNATDIYLTYDHIKQQLKATWSPSKPEHSDIEWKSSDESIAKVSSDGTVRGVSSGVE